MKMHPTFALASLLALVSLGFSVAPSATCVAQESDSQAEAAKPNSEAANRASSNGQPLNGQSLNGQKIGGNETAEAKPRTRGDGRLAPTTSKPSYGKQWALIVGINYEHRDDARETIQDKAALPPLQNAVKDAEQFAHILKTYYQYEEDKLRLLTEKEATKATIEGVLGSLCDASRISEEDSVLVYFSGHGVRTHQGTTFLAHNVKLAQGKPISGHLRLHQDVIELLKQCPAKHKMVILDHCYSGDIFNVGFQPQSNQDRSGKDLLQTSAFQAMASCRATQVALDGEQSVGNSPFTAALIAGLTRLPANGHRHDRVWASRLLSYIVPRFDVESQKPDCRNLVGTEGEFSFIPDPDADFTKFRIDAGDRNLLTAMASRQGGWWFDERPWFIPSVRELILRQWALTNVTNRGAEQVFHIDEDALRNAAAEAFKNKNSYRESVKKQYDLIVRTHGTNNFDAALASIAEELEKNRTKAGSAIPANDTFPAADTHLLAILQHSLGRAEDAQETYKEAIKKYEDLFRKSEDPTYQIPAALCRADYGELLLNELEKSQEAAKQFRASDTGIRTLASNQDAGAVFRLSVLCREADAYLGVNRWPEANRLLDDALDLANSFAADSYFSAHVHRRRAWAQIIQWQMRDARRSFETSNQILANLFRSKRDLEASDDDVVEQPSLNHASMNLFDVAFRESKDFASKIAYLHNLHGIDMALRFQGDTRGAAKQYRSLARHVEGTFSDLIETTTDENLEKQFITRSINTLERLGDCNLFGNPAEVDIKQSVDDYRRARSLVHRVPSNKRDRINATLLYKNAIALAMPDTLIQDTDLAMEMCLRADKIFTPHADDAKGLYWALGSLTTKIVALLHNADRSGSLDYESLSPREELRAAILKCRDEVGQYPHRDQLEILLFATKILLEQGNEQNRFQKLEDSDLLLTFCRIALNPYQFEDRRNPTESTNYLRPYYDAVMKAKLEGPKPPKHVLDLLEIQSEATTGTRYVKSDVAQPVLATYILDGKCWLLLDLPEGESKAISLANIYDVQTIKDTSYSQAGEGSNDNRLVLPLEVSKLLKEWRLAAQQKQIIPVGIASIDVRWEDPVNGFTETIDFDDNSTGDVFSVARASLQGSCPFRLPEGFDEAIPAETVAQN